MEPSGFWKKFESTGRIGDYLAFKQQGQPGAWEEEWNADDDDGAGAAGDEDR